MIAVVAAATFEILLSRAEPILRARLIQSLSARFHSRVEMGAFDVSLLRGFEVSGKDLAIYPYNINSTTPTFSVRRFAFRTGYRSLVSSPMHINHVEVEGLRINLPPKSQRKELPQLNTGQGKGSNVEHHGRRAGLAPTPCSLWAQTSRASSPSNLSSRA